MEVTLRRKQYGGWWQGLGDSGETDSEGSGLPTDGGNRDYSSGEVDLSTIPGPGYNIPTQPGSTLSDEEFLAEQARAREWLKNLPNILDVAGRITMTATELANGIKAGVVKSSITCPSGYLVGTDCVAPVPQSAAGTSLIPGLPNSTLAMIGGGLLLLVLMRPGGRR